MTSLAKSCGATVDFLVKRKLISSFETDGQWIAPESTSRPLVDNDHMLILHHLPLKGELYGYFGGWGFVYNFVKSFTRAGRQNTSCLFDTVFGPLGVPLDRVIDEIPLAFAQLGFELKGAPSPDKRRVLFGRAEQSNVDDLPEPYGKWLQHKENNPKWGKPVELEVQFLCRFSSPEEGVTHIDIEASTFALPILVSLGAALTALFDLSHSLTIPDSYLGSNTSFTLTGAEISLKRLTAR